MVTGQLPFVSETHAQMAIVLKHIYGPIPLPSKLNPSLPEGIERINFKLMAKDSEDCYQSAEEVIEHLDWVKAGVLIPEEIASPIDLGRAVEQTGQATSVSSTLSFLVPVSAAEVDEAVRMAAFCPSHESLRLDIKRPWMWMNSSTSTLTSSGYARSPHSDGG